MTRDQELPLVREAKAGNQVAILKLWKQYEKSVIRFCSKYRNLDSLSKEDLQQEAYFYFIEAIQKFDESNGAKFHTLLISNLRQIYRYITYNDFIMRRPGDYFTVAKQTQDFLKAVSIDAPITEGDSDSFAETYVDPYADFESEHIKRESKNLINSLIKSELNKLSALNRTIVELYIYTDLTHSKVAILLDVKEPYVKKTIARFRDTCTGRRNILRDRGEL